MRQRFDIADIIIKTEMVIKWKIEKNKNTNLNPWAYQSVGSKQRITHGFSNSTTAKSLSLSCLLRASQFPHPFHAQDISETTRPADL